MQPKNEPPSTEFVPKAAGMRIANDESSDRVKHLLGLLHDECCATGTPAQVAERCRSIAELTEKLTGYPYEGES